VPRPRRRLWDPRRRQPTRDRVSPGRAVLGPVGRSVLEEAVVVGVVAVAPAALCVVAGLLWQERRIVGVEIDRALAIGVAIRLIQDVHG
jgi:hypothetical protein